MVLKKTLQLLVLFMFSQASAQDNYWIFFKERDLGQSIGISKKTVKNRQLLGLPSYQESDFGPKNSDIDKLKTLGINLRKTSRWFNAVSAKLTTTQIKTITQFPFIASIKKFESKGNLAALDTNSQIYLSYALAYTKAASFIEKGWLGEGVDIGVVDGGFYELDKEEFTSHLIKNNRIAGYKDFFEPNRKLDFSEKKNNGELHGTQVVSHIGGFSNAKKNVLAGLALKSNYFLARTETSGRESRVEEDNWIAAMEWLDSLGVRLVNSSLGYSLGFTDSTENYKTTQMDGNTSMIAKGAKMAVLEKGMIIVSAAGNEGENKRWKGLVSTPGDVEEVISVGALNLKGLKMGYSSIGTNYTQFVKPDVAVISFNGTSLAAPVVTGIVAGMLQAKSDLTWKEVKDILHQNSSNFAFPNNYIGYGQPDLELIANYLEGDYTAPTFSISRASKSLEVACTQEIAVFHKSNEKQVTSQDILKCKNGKATVRQTDDKPFSTLISEGVYTEVSWLP